VKITDLFETRATHQTTPAAAAAIRANGFDIGLYGTGAGAGPGEPAGVFVSLGDGADFSRENATRRLGMSETITLTLHVDNVLNWQPDERLAFFKEMRLEFLHDRFDLSPDDAVNVVRYSLRVMRERPDLEKITDWLGSRDGERELAMFLNRKLRELGYDAVRYRESFRGVDQMIVLDPSKITIES
jgi:hypothetical protein